MKFFIPGAKDKTQEESVHGAITEFLHRELGADFDARRVFSLRYIHEGKEYHAEVGEPHSVNGELVIAILHEPGRRLYHVCTPNRGVVRDMSILVGEHEVKYSKDFEPE